MIFAILYWIVSVFLLMPDIAKAASSLKLLEKTIAWVTTIIGAPIMCIAQVFMTILDELLPEGWDNNDGGKFV